MKAKKVNDQIRKTPKKDEIKIGDKFVINSGDKYVYRRHMTHKDDKDAQLVSDGTYLEHMLKRQFRYYNPKIGETLEIVDLEKPLTPGHSESKKFTIKIGDNYYSDIWRSIKDLIK